MTTAQLHAQEYKETQRKYMAIAKVNRRCDVTRKMAVDMALLNRRYSREWAAIN
ncbi:hypothetical protein [Moellerella wisconsensis]|uniref:hypothetical protein n=1 Tax=Moellerella wisconsensis TaxID=158849 RepID=UPI003AAECE24